MTGKKVTTAASGAKNAAEADLRRVNAYKAVFEGNSTKQDAEIVLSDLLNVTGYFRPPNYADWMQRTKTPAGFELHCALQAARAEPMRHIMDKLQISNERMIALEKAAREERGGSI